MKIAMVVSAIILGITYLAYAPKWWRSPLAITVVVYVVGMLILHKHYEQMAVVLLSISHILAALFVSREQERSYREYRNFKE